MAEGWIKTRAARPVRALCDDFILQPLLDLSVAPPSPTQRKSMPISPTGQLRLSAYQSSIREAAKERRPSISDQNIERYRQMLRSHN